MSCAGNGYLSGNMLVAFPFEDGAFLSWADGLDAAEMQLALQRCFVDAGIYVPDSPSDDNRPMIGDVSVDGTSLSFKVSVGGAGVRLSVSGTTGTRFPIASGSADWGSYVVVMSSEGISDFCALVEQISPPSGLFASSSFSGSEGLYLPLCARCATYRPAGLRSIMVYDGWHEKDEGPHFTLSGDVLVKPGNNMLLSESDDDPNEIGLNADPGAGLGVIPCPCTDDDIPDGIMIAGPDGHTRVFNDTCYDLEPNTTTGELKMHVKCTACCTCEMYESIVNDRLARLADSVRQAKKDITKLHREYESAVSKFNARIASPKFSDISMTLSGMPIGAKVSPVIGNSKVKGRMGRCVFTATISNSSYFEVTARVSVSATDFIAEASAAWSGADGSPLSKTGDGAGSVAGSYSIYPGRSLVVTFIAVKSELVSKVVTGGYTGTAIADISWNGRHLGSLNKTVRA